MATQFADTAPRSFPIAAPKPNIKIAYIAGPAVSAVHAELAKLPAVEQDRTLDEMFGTRASFIERCASVLSAPMRRAFYRWLDICLRVEATPSEDEEAIDRNSDLHDDLIRELMAVPAQCNDDMLLKAHVWAIDASPASCSTLGPIANHTNVRGFRADETPVDIGKDLLRLSSLSEMLNHLADKPPAELPALLRVSAERLGDSPWQAQYVEAVDAFEKMVAFQREHLAPLYKLSKEAAAAGLDAGSINKIAGQREDEHSELAGSAYRAIDALFLVPMPHLGALELATDLAKRASMPLCDDEGHLIAGVANSVGNLLAGDADNHLTRAFTTFRGGMVTLKGSELLPSVEEATYQTMDAASEELKAQAHTITGVIAKLRVAFQGKVADGWADHAVLDPRHAEFVEGVAHGDMFDEIMWSSIEDLARIAGVNLAEQGA